MEKVYDLREEIIRSLFLNIEDRKKLSEILIKNLEDAKLKKK